MGLMMRATYHTADSFRKNRPSGSPTAYLPSMKPEITKNSPASIVGVSHALDSTWTDFQS